MSSSTFNRTCPGSTDNMGEVWRNSLDRCVLANTRRHCFRCNTTGHSSHSGDEREPGLERQVSNGCKALSRSWSSRLTKRTAS